MKKTKNNKGLVLWFTGLPCSGKTTLAKELEKYFIKKNKLVQRLDGDVIRKTICSDLDFSKKNRDENIRRVSHVARMLSENGVNVIVSFVSPYRKMRSFARKICPNFVEAYVKCGLEECIRRDLKGMYKKALKGEINNFTGINDPYEEPKNPEIILNTEKENVKESLMEIISYINKNKKYFFIKK